MAYTRIKRFGNQDYAYEIEEYWDPKQKRSRQRSKYLGVVIDKNKKIYEKRKPKILPEKLILDFGDTYSLNQFFQTTALYPLLKNIFLERIDTLIPLLFYRLCYTGAMVYTKRWYEGNFVKLLHKSAAIDSQRISDFLKYLGEEDIQRNFFQNYLKELPQTEKGIIIDATSLPNQIHVPMTEWGRSGEEIDKQIRFLLAVDKNTSRPLFFRTIPGNIVDVSTVKNTIEELSKYGIKDCFIYSDAGFFSEDNIKEYYSHNINFLTRLPATRTLYKDLIKNEAPLLEKFQNGVKYGKRGLFIKEKTIDLFGKPAYAYLVQDPRRKGRELERYLIENLDEKEKNPDQEYEFINNGIMILVSSFKIPKEDVVPAYYIRQTAEMLFGFSKDDLGILPLRVHSDERLSGFLFLQFLTLILFVELKNKLGKDHTVEEMMITMRNLKCKVYDNEILISELTREQKEITKKLSIEVPKLLKI